MRKFDEADKKKKKTRIQIPENPGNLSKELLSQLEDRVKASLQDSHLPCAVAFKIAMEVKVPKIAVGGMADAIGVRVTNCQIGCFKVDKIIPDKSVQKKADGKILSMIETLEANKELTCANVFALAQQLKLAPMTIADVANLHNLKVHNCQLGCF